MRASPPVGIVGAGTPNRPSSLHWPWLRHPSLFSAINYANGKYQDWTRGRRSTAESSHNNHRWEGINLHRCEYAEFYVPCLLCGVCYDGRYWRHIIKNLLHRALPFGYVKMPRLRFPWLNRKIVTSTSTKPLRAALHRCRTPGALYRTWRISISSIRPTRPRLVLFDRKSGPYCRSSRYQVSRAPPPAKCRDSDYRGVL
ncbi:hypothetical protein BU26DRAFT_321874 [Trematosphaeria pertusa]|uniref:Uncharacterized protein n=1 Tax=Trematosphaeria pertusa TaxID=390896 RepID=A0A6A6IB95_9PLEO|nr:uncharacterized protein BU26DRAFT_321874 [Trematosphaeria pertusa]KAF2247845.1 hypothetical protein BU26DRAFT_321874 [Trematosphaeria pertusa]